MKKEALPESKLKVSDIIPLKEETRDELISTMKELDRLSQEYYLIEDPFELDRLKREFNVYLQRFAVLFSKIKIFKSSTHTYLEGEIRNFKKASLSFPGERDFLFRQVPPPFRSFGLSLHDYLGSCYDKRIRSGGAWLDPRAGSEKRHRFAEFRGRIENRRLSDRGNGVCFQSGAPRPQAHAGSR